MRHRHPVLRDIAADFKRCISDVAALRYNLAEFSCAAGDESTVRGFAIFPNCPERRRQAELRHRAKRFCPPVLPSEPISIDAKPDDITDPVGIDAINPQQIINCLPVRPGFH